MELPGEGGVGGVDWLLGYPKQKDSVYLCGLSVFIMLMEAPASWARASAAGDSMVDLLKKSTDRSQSEHIGFIHSDSILYSFLEQRRIGLLPPRGMCTPEMRAMYSLHSGWHV